MSVTVKVDLREFQDSLRQYMAHTEKDLAKVINTKALYIARGALANTTKANRQDIERLGIEAYRIIKSKKTGKFSQGRAIYSNSMPGMGIFLTKKYGPNEAAYRGARTFSNAEALKEWAKKRIANRIRSITFLKSGWLPALQTLIRRLGESVNTEGVKRFKKTKGFAKLAVPSFDPVCEIGNQSIPETGNAKDIATAALKKAFDDEAKSMRTYIEKKLQERANKYNAR